MNFLSDKIIEPICEYLLAHPIQFVLICIGIAVVLAMVKVK